MKQMVRILTRTAAAVIVLAGLTSAALLSGIPRIQDRAEAASCRIAPRPAACALKFAARRSGIAIGASISQGVPERERSDILVHFNAVSDENAFKWSSMEPTQGNIDFSDTDALVEWANSHRLRLRAHTLFWHRYQTPTWVTNAVAGASDPAATLGALMDERIEQVVGRYKGEVKIYDVVNEPLETFGPGWDTTNTIVSRSNFFYLALGERYIDRAFRAVRRVDPKAKLFLNETVWNPAIGDPKADAFLALVKRLKRRGVPIDGVGLQTHGMFGLTPPSFPGSTASFKRYMEALGRLGVKVEITELDVALPLVGDVADPLAEQAKVYRRVVDACAQTRACVGVTTWNIRDSDTWLDTFPFTSGNAPNLPLLLDGEG
ncbi:MAG: endo-1,4-beta-xylanase, partial [bacterium]